MENINLPVLLPFDIGRKALQEGFYLQSTDRLLFYLSQKEGKWYFQFVSDTEPTLITKEGPLIEAIKIDPNDMLTRLKQEREFIESKLASLVEKK